MESRRLNRRVTIQRLQSGQDEIGQPVTTWTNLIATGDGKVQANIRHMSGSETIKADAQTSVLKASIRVRRRNDVTAAMRVLLGTTVYEVKTVIPDEEDPVYMDLACEVISA